MSKATTTTKTAKPATTKGKAKTATAKNAAPTAKVSSVVFYATQDKAAPYSPIHTQIGKAAYTVAALVCAGYMKIGTSGNPMKAGKGNRSTFRALVGQSAFNYWNRNKLIDGDEVSKAGLNKVSTRLDGTAPTYRTELQAIKDMIGAMQSKAGNTIEVGGEKVALTRKVEIQA